MHSDDVDLEGFRMEVMFNVLWSGIKLNASNDVGELPVVACLDSEPLEALMDRVTAAGGYATVFSRGSDDENGGHRVRRAAFIDGACALPGQAMDMTQGAPSPHASIGMFFDYLALQEDGVVLPKALGMKATGVERPQEVQFQDA